MNYGKCEDLHCLLFEDLDTHLTHFLRGAVRVHYGPRRCQAFERGLMFDGARPHGFILSVRVQVNKSYYLRW